MLPQNDKMKKSAMSSLAVGFCDTLIEEKKYCMTVGKDRHSRIAGVTVAHLAYIQKDGVRHPGDPPILDERSSELYADATAVRRATKEAVQKGRTDRILVPLQHREL